MDEFGTWKKPVMKHDIIQSADRNTFVQALDILSLDGWFVDSWQVGDGCYRALVMKEIPSCQ